MITMEVEHDFVKQCIVCGQPCTESEFLYFNHGRIWLHKRCATLVRNHLQQSHRYTIVIDLLNQKIRTHLEEEQ